MQVPRGRIGVEPLHSHRRALALRYDSSQTLMNVSEIADTRDDVPV